MDEDLRAALRSGQASPRDLVRAGLLDPRRVALAASLDHPLALAASDVSPHTIPERLQKRPVAASVVAALLCWGGLDLDDVTILLCELCERVLTHVRPELAAQAARAFTAAREVAADPGDPGAIARASRMGHLTKHLALAPGERAGPAVVAASMVAAQAWLTTSMRSAGRPLGERFPLQEHRESLVLRALTRSLASVPDTEAEGAWRRERLAGLLLDPGRRLRFDPLGEIYLRWLQVEPRNQADWLFAAEAELSTDEEGRAG